MKEKDKIIAFLERNNNSITTGQFEALGVRRNEIKYYIEANIVKRCARGVYISPKVESDEFYNYQLKHNNTIFSYDSALYLLGFNKEKSNKIHITTYRGNNPVENDDIYVHWVSKNKLNLGVILSKTKNGNIVKTYNLERCICDIIKNGDIYSSKERKEILFRYFSDPNRNYKLLTRYANIFKINSRIDAIMSLIESNK